MSALNLADAATVFPIIFVGELPDKSMFASLVMSTRGRPPQPIPVFIGAAAAFLVHVGIAVTLGVVLFHLVPHRVIEAVVAAMFLFGAILSFREASQDQGPEQEPAPGRVAQSKFGVAAVSFGIIFLAEWGDLTQILTANLAAHYHSPVSVGVGALLGLWAVAALAILSGQSLMRFVDVGLVRKITAALLLVLSGLAAWQLFR